MKKNFNVTFKSTRSKSTRDNPDDCYDYFNMVGFDVDKELNMLRIMCSILWDKKDSLDADIKFVIEAFQNIDEYLQRQGKFPDRWDKAKHKQEFKKIIKVQ